MRRRDTDRTRCPAPPPALPGMTAWELLAADVWATGMTTGAHPVALLRAHLDEHEALPLGGVESGTRVAVGCAITHRQRPPTAGGVTFVNLKDETGMLNIVASAGCWQAFRSVWRDALGVVVRGVLRVTGGVVSLDAGRVDQGNVRGVQWRDFH